VGQKISGAGEINRGKGMRHQRVERCLADRVGREPAGSEFKIVTGRNVGGISACTREIVFCGIVVGGESFPMNG